MKDVVWSYRPDDRSKQGTTESLPDDLAKQKVDEGLARWSKKPSGALLDQGGTLPNVPTTFIVSSPEQLIGPSSADLSKVPKQGTHPAN